MNSSSVGAVSTILLTYDRDPLADVLDDTRREQRGG
jgi:hypothetical protein